MSIMSLLIVFGMDLMIAFRRTISPILYGRWLDLVNLMTTIFLNGEEDMPMWMFHPS
jgi:hypothetical protein